MKKIHYLSLIMMICMLSVSALNAKAESAVSKVKQTNASYKYAGKDYYSVAADPNDNEGWVTDREFNIKSGKFSWSDAFVSAISVNYSPGAALKDPNRPRWAEIWGMGTSGISMFHSFIMGGRSGITDVKMLLQSKGNEHRMLLMYGTPIEQKYAGKKIWLSSVLINAHDDNMAYWLQAGKDADKLIRSSFKGLKKEGKYDMYLTYSKKLSDHPYKYSIVLSKDGKAYTYPIVHDGTKMEVYYKAPKAKTEYVFDATPYVKAEKLELKDQVKKDIDSYIKQNVLPLKPSIRFDPNTITLDIEKKRSEKIHLKIRDVEKKISLKSMNTSVATVDKKGVVHCKFVGKTTIIASVNGVSATCKVIVTAPGKISIDQKAIVLQEGKSRTLKATVTGKMKKAMWASANPSIATVDINGKVTAKKAGKTKIIARANGVSASCEVLVTKKYNLPPYPKNGQRYWIVFREGFRNNQIELTTCDVKKDTGGAYILRKNSSMLLGGATLRGKMNQYKLTDKGWEQIYTYPRFSDHAGEIIATNLDVYDSNGRLAHKKNPVSGYPGVYKKN